MFSLRFFLAVLVIAIVTTIVQWFFVGFLFHRYQAKTPTTWRKESGRSYAASTILSFFFAFMFMVIISLWISKYGSMSGLHGLAFGAICWLTFAIPLELGTAIYVNYDRMFVLGKCLSSIVEYMMAGWLATLIL